MGGHRMRAMLRNILSDFVLIATLAGAGGAWAQDWPAKPIRAVVPSTAGSAVDIVPRMVFEPLAAALGQPIIVENRPGAGGLTANAFVAKADPDGYTVLIDSSAHTVLPSLYPNAPYDPVRDLAGVILIGNLPNVLVVAPSQGWRSVQELVAAAKGKPGTISYASVGVGSATHFSAERLRLAAGFEGVHVPFRGAPEAYTEVMTGRVDFFFGAVASALPFIRDGRLTPLAVSTRMRALVLPSVPTTLEAGFANSDYTFWIALFVPARTPRAIIAKLHDAVEQILERSDIRDKLAALGVEPVMMSSAELDALVKTEIPSNAAVVKAANIKPE
jgi:tripartite-type tricarboxylate transporter receptor subunit TctC